MRYTDPKAKIVTEQTPFLDHCSDSGSHIERHQNRLECRVLNWDWVIEDHHHTVTSVAFEGAAVLDDDFTYGRVIVVQ